MKLTERARRWTERVKRWRARAVIGWRSPAMRGALAETAGIVAIVAGVWMLSPAAGLIVLGCALAGPGIVAMAQKRRGGR